jgi:hypothetical protein
LIPFCAHLTSPCVFLIPFMWVFSFSFMGIQFLLSEFLLPLCAHWVAFVCFQFLLCGYLVFP